MSKTLLSRDPIYVVTDTDTLIQVYRIHRSMRILRSNTPSRVCFCVKSIFDLQENFIFGAGTFASKYIGQGHRVKVVGSGSYERK